MSDSIPPKNKNNTTQNTPLHNSPNTHWKTLATLGAATVLVTSQLTGCGASEATAGSSGGEAAATAMQASGEGEGSAKSLPAGEGEGEGASLGAEAEGEGEGAASQGTDFSTDDAAYLTQLGLIRGHLRVGFQLYSDDLPGLAETHMKHPRAEIYSSLVPAFEKRGCPGFADHLTALTKAVTERQAKDSVNATYNTLLAAINQCEKTAAIDNAELVAKVIEDLLRTAGVEYKIGVIDGEIDNLHEYQDAWGFTQIAQEWAQSTAFKHSSQTQEMATQAQQVTAKLQPLWPSLNPAGGVNGDAAQLFGAAARIQLLALSLRDS